MESHLELPHSHAEELPHPHLWRTAYENQPVVLLSMHPSVVSSKEVKRKLFTRVEEEKKKCLGSDV